MLPYVRTRDLRIKRNKLKVEEQFSDERVAALYDVFHPPLERDDYRFYIELVMGADSVLDVGCGTGALLHEARVRGHSWSARWARPCARDAQPGSAVD